MQEMELDAQEHPNPSTTSKRERKVSQYTRVLRMGTKQVKGILNTYDQRGNELLPFGHQRETVKFFCSKAQSGKKSWGLIADHPGLGKTATFLQLMAALEIVIPQHIDQDGRRIGTSAIITAPKSTLAQWENTVLDWINIPSKYVLATSKKKELTDDWLKKNKKASLDKLRVLIVSRDCLALCYKDCYEYIEKYEQNERGNWLSKWVPISNVPLHPIFKRQWTMSGYDEAHFMRNPTTIVCVAHNRLSEQCDHRYALTATPIFNKPRDMVGLCKAIGATDPFQNKTFWSNDNNYNTINTKAVIMFRNYMVRNKETILNLPKIIDKTIGFDIQLSEKDALRYNSFLQEARNLRMSLENSSKKNQDDLRKLMALTQKMQQMIVSPLLAEKGSNAFVNSVKGGEVSDHSKNIDLAAEMGSGVLRKLRDVVVDMINNLGIKRVVIACEHVAPMMIGRKFLQRYFRNNVRGLQNVKQEVDGVKQELDVPALDPRASNMAQGSVKCETTEPSIYMFEGSMRKEQRQNVKDSFLNAEGPSILFLSIGAGGTGLHLVGEPSEPSGIILCFSSPWSPAQVEQTIKRIHRIGQDHKVHVRHLVAYGSVDYAIRKSHVCKQNLADYVIDGDKKALGELGELAHKVVTTEEEEGDKTLGGCTWKQVSRLVEMCNMVDVETGNFPPEPTPEEVAAQTAANVAANTMNAPPISIQKGFPIGKLAVSASLASNGSKRPIVVIEPPKHSTSNKTQRLPPPPKHVVSPFFDPSRGLKRPIDATEPAPLNTPTNNSPGSASIQALTSEAPASSSQYALPSL